MVPSSGRDPLQQSGGYRDSPGSLLVPGLFVGRAHPALWNRIQGRQAAPVHRRGRARGLDRPSERDAAAVLCGAAEGVMR